MFDVNGIDNDQNNINSISNPSAVDGTKSKSNKDQSHKPLINRRANDASKEEKSAEISEATDEIKEKDTGKVRDHLNLVLIGHVDHGKSTIAGQILLSLSLYPRTQS